MATLGIPSNTIEVLQKYHFNFQKKFGQNFLIDTHVLEKIMNAAQISKDDCVVEVGPGIGTHDPVSRGADGACGGGRNRQSSDPDFVGYAVRL